MIYWTFKCKICKYTFRAKTPQKDYDACIKCPMCGEKDFEKKVKDEPREP